ncbi:protein arginine N-methyltransferase 9-like [Tachypleus tridentatus]|uniref:protein arginine N-methyltransferase 9-like n=1 Tax=Tachypleus tridentatus TaxID=6853 RepID=UPI003FD5D07A
MILMDKLATATSRQLMSGQTHLLKRSRLRAEVCLKKHQYSLALAHLCVVFQLDPGLKHELKSKLLFALERHTKMLEDRKCWKELFQCYEQVLEVIPECEDVHYNLGILLYKCGYTYKAACCFQKAWALKPDHKLARLSLENLKTQLLQRWHFLMLNDMKRNEAFSKAIHEAVNAGYSNVLDVGAGTGILSMCAVMAGADQVTACEMSEVLCVTAADVLKANNMDKRVKVINKHSTEIMIPSDLPERVSLLVTETFDAGLFGEHILHTLQHAWENLLLSPKVSTAACDKAEQTSLFLSKDVFSQQGFVIPSKATVWAALVECEWIRKKSSKVDSLGPVDVCKIFTRKRVNEEPYDTERLNSVRGGFQYLSNPFQVIEVDFNNPTEIQQLLYGVETRHYVKCVKAGQLDAVVMWFVLELYQDITISSSPESGSCWEQAVFPVSSSDVDLQDIVEESSVIVTAVCKEYLHLHCSQVFPTVRQETCCAQSPTNTLDSLISVQEPKSQNHLTSPNQQRNSNFSKTKPQEVDHLYKLTTIEVNSDMLRILNDDLTNTLQFEIISDMARQGALDTLIDVCNFPYVGLLAAKTGSTTSDADAVEEKHTVIRLAKMWDIPPNKLLFTSVEHLCHQCVHPDVFISDVVEISGLPNFDVIHNIATLR